MALSPFSQAFSGQCDSTGAGTITIQGPASYYVAVYLPVEVSAGSPVWVIRQGQAPLIFGSGLQTQLGPIVLSPGEKVNVTLSGANANATVDGQMIGWSAIDPSELPPALPAPASVNISGGTVNATITVNCHEEWATPFPKLGATVRPSGQHQIHSVSAVSVQP